MSDETLNQFVKRKRREAAEERMFQMPDPLPDENGFRRSDAGPTLGHRLFPNLFPAEPYRPQNTIEVDPQTLQDLLAWGNEEPVAGGITRATIGLSLELLPQLQPEPILVFPPHTYLEP